MLAKQAQAAARFSARDRGRQRGRPVFQPTPSDSRGDAERPDRRRPARARQRQETGRAGDAPIEGRRAEVGSRTRRRRAPAAAAQVKPMAKGHNVERVENLDDLEREDGDYYVDVPANDWNPPELSARDLGRARGRV